MTTPSTAPSGVPAPATGGSTATLRLEDGRLLVGSFDALIRAVRSRGSGLPTLARRVRNLWHQQDKAMVFEATAVLIDDRVALRAEEQEGRWILPTFMSGLRQLRAADDLDADDVLRLAEELAELSPAVESLTAFQDWLWSEGAEGFEIDLQPSFVEVMEAVSSSAQTAEHAVLAVRGPSAGTLHPDALSLAADEIDAAAARPELAMPLSLYARAIEQSRFELDDDAVDALADACDEAGSWVGAETDVVLAHPDLAASVPPTRLARRIVALAGRRVSPQLLDRLATIGQGDDRYARTLFEALETQQLGIVLSRGIRIDSPAMLDAVDRFVRTAPATLGRGLLVPLAHSAETDSLAMDALAELLTGERAPELLAVIHERKDLGAAEHLTISRALLRSQTGTAELPAMLGALPAQTAATVLTEVPSEVFEQLQPTVSELLASSSSGAREAVATTLLDLETDRGVEMLVESLQGARDHRWSRPSLRRILGRLATRRGGDDVCLRLVRSQTTGQNVRIAALEALAMHPQILADAVKWRLGELFDPPVLRRELKRLRQELAS